MKQLNFLGYKRNGNIDGSIKEIMNIFKSTFHTNYTELKNKITLLSFDAKRYDILGEPQTKAWKQKYKTSW